MSDRCCEHQSSACCEPAQLLSPPKSDVTERHSRIAVASSCADGVPVFDGVGPCYRRVLWAVIGINGAIFLTEMIAGQLAGSQALKADALDFRTRESELRNREPGMMTLIAVAISVAFFYSAAVTFGFQGESFYWEVVTLIDVMLLGHWLEMRSVMRASRALEGGWFGYCRTLP
jgi:cation transport ATPase